MGGVFSAACASGDVEIVRLLLQHNKSDFLECDDKGNSAFMRPSKAGMTEIVAELLQSGKVNVAQPNHLGNTPLYFACAEGRNEIITMLLKDSRINPSYTNKYGQTPLFIACFNGMVETVKILLADGRVDPTLPDNFGNSPAFVALSKGHTDVVLELIQSCPDFKLDKATLDVVQKKNYVEIIEAVEECATVEAPLPLSDDSNEEELDKENIEESELIDTTHSNPEEYEDILIPEEINKQTNEEMGTEEPQPEITEISSVMEEIEQIVLEPPCAIPRRNYWPKLILLMLATFVLSGGFYMFRLKTRK